MNNSNLCEISVSNSNIGTNSTISKVFKVLKFIFYILAAYFLYATLMTFSFYWILCIVAIVLALFAKYMQGRFNCSCDYVFVDGTLRFTKVVRATKRFKIAEFDCKEIEMLYLVNSPNFIKKANSRRVKLKYALAHLKQGVKIAINYLNNGKDTLLIIKFDRIFLSYIIRRINSRKIDKDLMEYLSGSHE